MGAGVWRRLKDSASQPPADRGDLTHRTRIVHFHPSLWLLGVVIGFPSFPLWGNGGSVNLPVVLRFWSQVSRGRGGRDILSVFSTK